MAFICRHRKLLTEVLFKVLASVPHSMLLWKVTSKHSLTLIRLIFFLNRPCDTNLLVPEITDVDINDEFNNVLKWAEDNRMIVNLHKTKEIVFHRPSARYSLPSLVTGNKQVVSAKLLGITFSHNLKFDEHVKNILTICNQRSYLLKCLKGQGLPSKELHTVFCAMIVSHILYALLRFFDC